MSYLLTTVVGLIILGVALGAAAEPLPADFVESLKTEKQIYVATQRADGARSKAVPIWFWWDGSHVYFTTSPDSHKVRRIRSGSPIFFSFAADGPFVQGRPEIIDDLGVVERMGEAYNEKYWISWMGFFRPRPQRVADGKTVAVKVALE
jgi:hypothetical protein